MLGAILGFIIDEGVGLIVHKIGCLGIIISVIFIGVGAFFIVSEDVGDPIFESLFCAEDETFTRTTRPSFDTGGEFVNFSCQNENGDLNRVDGQVLLVVFIPLIPLFISVALLIVGTIRRVSKSTGGLLQNFATPAQGANIQTYTYTSKLGQTETNPDFKSMSPLELMTWMENLQNVQPNQQSSQQLTLKEKLRQLQSAYDEGLITEEEFDRRKQAVLDELMNG